MAGLYSGISVWYVGVLDAIAFLIVIACVMAESGRCRTISAVAIRIPNGENNHKKKPNRFCMSAEGTQFQLQTKTRSRTIAFPKSYYENYLIYRGKFSDQI